jgi:hypothetical protein
MKSLDQAVIYLSSHWLVAAAVIVWYSAVIGGLGETVEKWRMRRIMRRTAKLRKESFHRDHD